MSSCMGLKLSYPKQAFNACLMSVASGVMPLSFSRLQSYAIFPVPGTHRPGTGLPARWHRFAPKRVHLCQPPGTGVPRKRTTRPSALPLPTRTTRPEAPRPPHRTKPLAKKAILRQAAGCPAGRWWNNRFYFVKYCYRGGNFGLFTLLAAHRGEKRVSNVVFFAKMSDICHAETALSDILIQQPTLTS